VSCNKFNRRCWRQNFRAFANLCKLFAKQISQNSV
jgi:hypothetical protein